MIWKRTTYISGDDETDDDDDVAYDEDKDPVVYIECRQLIISLYL